MFFLALDLGDLRHYCSVMSSTHCSNCRNPFKGGVLSLVERTTESNVFLINEFGGGQSSGYCQKCEPMLLRTAKEKYSSLKIQYSSFIERHVSSIPVLSIHSPFNWDYSSRGLVTSQCVLGTGIIIELASAFTDLLGRKSETYNKKLQEGEKFCIELLRKKALELNCNAVLGVDIDYSEVGSSKAMLMICMTGTAVKVSNVESAFEKPEDIALVMESSDWLQKYRNINI